jgi:hypothetical protein
MKKMVMILSSVHWKTTVSWYITKKSQLAHSVTTSTQKKILHPLEEDCVWTLYFSFSPNDLLDCVEKGEYKVNKTKQNWIAQEQFNYEVWDPTSWVGVDIP